MMSVIQFSFQGFNFFLSRNLVVGLDAGSFVEDECLPKALISLQDGEDGNHLDNCSLASICRCVWGDS